jgi:hypothetical protein
MRCLDVVDAHDGNGRVGLPRELRGGVGHPRLILRGTAARTIRRTPASIAPALVTDAAIPLARARTRARRFEPAPEPDYDGATVQEPAA